MADRMILEQLWSLAGPQEPSLRTLGRMGQPGSGDGGDGGLAPKGSSLLLPLLGREAAAQAHFHRGRLALLACQLPPHSPR